MKIVMFSDTHGTHEQVELPEADVAIFAGDFSTIGDEGEATRFLDWYSSQHQCLCKILVAGNHDRYFERLDRINAGLACDWFGINYLCDSYIELRGTTFWGSPYTPAFFNWAFMEKRGNEMKKHWDLIPTSPHVDVLITHGPPMNILDSAKRAHGMSENVGCYDLAQAVKRKRPAVHVFGHIHNNYGHVKKDGTDYYNVSLVDDLYDLVNKPVVIELPSEEVAGD